MKRWLLLAAALMSGCETPNKPPLPKFALGAAPPKATEDEKWTATVNRADVIYFGLTKRSAAESEPAWRLVEALQRNGARVALGWTELSATQQPILDQWQRAGNFSATTARPARRAGPRRSATPRVASRSGASRARFAAGTPAQDPRRRCPHGRRTRAPSQELQIAPRCLR